ncbi:MAG: tRNA pseudouridine(38-40) synthase TruA [Planctomycetota bacterium]
MPRSREPSTAGKRNIRLTIEYDGTDFSGWQRQANARTVQECLEGAVEKVTGERVTLAGSGRTDAGVHAEGQVANFRTASGLPTERLLAAINANLDPDVAVVSSEEAPGDFNANRDAVAKVYRYTISTRPVRPVLGRRFVHRSKFPLDAKAMRRAARHLVGRHDFNSFRAEGRVEKNTVRTIERIDFEETPGTLHIRFTGDGFLYMMVRIMVGTLLEVGRGRLAPEDIPGIIAAGNREAAGPTAQAQGLCLVEVRY